MSKYLFNLNNESIKAPKALDYQKFCFWHLKTTQLNFEQICEVRHYFKIIHIIKNINKLLFSVILSLLPKSHRRLHTHAALCAPFPRCNPRVSTASPTKSANL